MGDGTKENPYTREDVIRLIAENGGKAVGLDLSGKEFESGIDLSGLNLAGIILEKATLQGAHFEKSNFLAAHLEEADLSFAHFEGAELFFTYLEGTFLWSTHFSLDTRLEGVRWGNYTVGEEKDGMLPAAIITYRRLKTWYAEHGMYDIAGQFFFREMTTKRKMMRWWPKPWNRAFSKLLSILCGYGERPLRVVVSAVVVVFGLAAVYYLFGGLTVPYSLYYSAVSFTALGYGRWVDIMPQGWVQAFGAAESFIGVFMLALFLITFVRKMAR